MHLGWEVWACGVVSGAGSRSRGRTHAGCPPGSYLTLASVSRGKMDVFISVKSENGSDAQVSLNRSVLEGYLEAMRQMA